MTDYFDANRRRWDEAVALHIKGDSKVYRLSAFRAGADILGPIENDELGDVAGKRVLHLQCHFGLDTLCLARRGAEVTGLDFSSAAIKAARALSRETGVPATFVEGNLYDAPDLIDGAFDLVFVTWGAINWLPDIGRWAEIVAHFLKPGGALYLLEGHPVTLIFEENGEGGFVPTYPYFQGPDPIASDETTTYTGEDDRLENTRAYEWSHPLSAVVNAVIAAGLRLVALNEHVRLPWQAFPSMRTDADGMEVMPADLPSMPLAFSLRAVKDAPAD